MLLLVLASECSSGFFVGDFELACECHAGGIMLWVVLMSGVDCVLIISVVSTPSVLFILRFWFSQN
jgi:hypothetical protein